MSDDDALRQMRETNRVFEEEVVARRNFAALDRVYTRAARILPPRAPMVEGRDAIRDFWRTAVTTMNIWAIRLMPLDVQVQGDRALEVARGEIDAGGSDGPIAIKYVVAWRREDAAWRWGVDIWNLTG